MVNQLQLPEHMCHWRMRPFYELEPYWIERSIWFGVDVVPSLTRGVSQTSVRDSDTDAWIWSHSRMGECIGARHFGVLRESLDWDIGRPNRGYTFIVPDSDAKMSVKTTDHWKRFLIYSRARVSPNSDSWRKLDFDRLMLVKSYVMERPPQFQFQIWGHVSKERFFRECKWADGRWPVGLDKGTPYLHENELDLIDQPLTP
jgi:hypothetical protein